MSKKYSLELSLKNPKTVKELHISLEYNDIESLDKLDKFKYIEELSIYSAEKLTKIPPALFKLTSLKKLSLSSLNVSEISSKIGQLKKLETLKIRSIPIKKLPKEIGQLKKLKVLYIDDCPVTEIPESISSCKSLEDLNFSSLDISNLNAIDFSKLKELQYLSLIKLPHFNVFPSNAFAAPLISFIRIYSTKLEGALPEFEPHPRFTHLHLSSNAITKIPKSISLLELSSLDLRSNEIQEVPTELFSPKLECFRLNSNPLTSIPKGFLDWFGSFKFSGLEDFSSRSIDTHIFNDIALGKIHQLASSVVYRKQDTITKEAFLNIYINQLEKIKVLPLTQIYKALQSRNQTLIKNALRFLTQPTESQSLKEGAKIFALCPPQTSLEQLNEQLSPFKIQLYTKYNEHITHVLIGSRGSRKLDQLPSAVDWIWITEKVIYNFLDEVQPSFLVEKDASTDIEKVSQLVFSMEEDNMGLALQLIEAGGLPSSLITELFIIFKFSKTKEYIIQAKQLLLRKASPALEKVLKNRSKIDKSIYYESYSRTHNFRSLIFEFADGTGIDLGKLAVAYNLRYKENLIDLAIDYSDGKLQQLILARHINDNSLTLTLAYFPMCVLEFEQLQKLDISIKNLHKSKGQTIFEIPKQIYKLKGLQTLILNYCPFQESEIPVASLQLMSNLKRLEITVDRNFNKNKLRAALPNVEIEFNHWMRRNPS